MSTSQAPLTERVVPYLLLAEFDIDEGSVLRHEYPSPTGTDQHLLAELMLPDGVHSRSEDWTVFFLNQSTLKPQATAAAAAAAPASAAGAVGPPVTMNEADQPLLHVLNLVRTKKDDTVRRCGHLQPAWSCRDALNSTLSLGILQRSGRQEFGHLHT